VPFNVFSSDAPSGSSPGGTTTTTTGDDTEGASSSFETPSFGSGRIPEQAPPSFTLPGFYGQGSTTLYGGTGRLGRPRFEVSASLTIGYDDNIFQTPSDDTPTIIPGGNVIVDEGEPDRFRQTGTTTRIDDGGLEVEVPVFERIPGRDPSVRFEDLEILAPERIGSLFTRSNLNLQLQRYTRRSLFTLDLNGGQTYYFEKDEDPVEYNGTFAVSYLYRFTPRLQITAQFNTAYLSQPDLSRPNTPERDIRGDLINTLARFDVGYRLTPRWSATLTSSYNGERYTEKAEQVGESDDFTFGLEMRYLWQPRWTLLAEARHSIVRYPQNSLLDSDTNYLLVGTEFTLSPRLTGSLRFGAAFKQFKEGGGQQTAPYVESSLNYRSTARSTVTWTNRFGFEEAQSADQERLVYRTSISYGYLFTARLRGSIAANLTHEISTSKSTGAEFAQDTFDTNIGLDYRVSKDFSVNLGYNFTIVNSNVGVTDYYRNRITFGGQYEF
jgi:hypothetical protein